MLDRLYALPEGLILALTVLTMVGLMAGLPLLVQRLPWMRPSDQHTDFVVRTQATLFTMTSLVLTFTLVQADINYRQADSLVSTEAARLDQLDRLLARFGDPDVARARPLLLSYATSLVRDEWPTMLDEDRHNATSRAFTALSRRILAIEPRTDRQNLVLAELFKTLDTLADLRAQRLSMVKVRLPELYWWVIALAIAMLCLVSSSIQQTAFRRTICAPKPPWSAASWVSSSSWTSPFAAKPRSGRMRSPGRSSGWRPVSTDRVSLRARAEPPQARRRFCPPPKRRCLQCGRRDGPCAGSPPFSWRGWSR